MIRVKIKCVSHGIQKLRVQTGHIDTLFAAMTFTLTDDLDVYVPIKLHQFLISSFPFLCRQTYRCTHTQTDSYKRYLLCHHVLCACLKLVKVIHISVRFLWMQCKLRSLRPVLLTICLYIYYLQNTSLYYLQWLGHTLSWPKIFSKTSLSQKLFHLM